MFNIIIVTQCLGMISGALFQNGFYLNYFSKLGISSAAIAMLFALPPLLSTFLLLPFAFYSDRFGKALASVIAVPGYVQFNSYWFLISLFTAAVPLVFGLMQKDVFGFTPAQITLMGTLFLAGSVGGCWLGGGWSTAPEPAWCSSSRQPPFPRLRSGHPLFQRLSKANSCSCNSPIDDRALALQSGGPTCAPFLIGTRALWRIALRARAGCDRQGGRQSTRRFRA